MEGQEGRGRGFLTQRKLASRSAKGPSQSLSLWKKQTLTLTLDPFLRLLACLPALDACLKRSSLHPGRAGRWLPGWLTGRPAPLYLNTDWIDSPGPAPYRLGFTPSTVSGQPRQPRQPRPMRLGLPNTPYGPYPAFPARQGDQSARRQQSNASQHQRQLRKRGASSDPSD